MRHFTDSRGGLKGRRGICRRAVGRRSIEILEARNLLAGTQVEVGLFSGELEITGTSKADVISLAVVSGGVQIKVGSKVLTIGGDGNGNTSVPLAEINEIRLDAKEANDQIKIASIPLQIILDGGDGTDAVTITGATTANSFSVGEGEFFANNVATDFNNVESLTVNGQGEADTFTVTDVPFFPITFNGGGGTDTVVGSNNQFLNSANNSWQITGAGAGQLQTSFFSSGATQHSAILKFTAVENLTGGSSIDQFEMKTKTGKITGNIDGGGGISDLLSYNVLPSVITTNLQTHSSTGVGHFSNFEFLTGGISGKNKLIGPDQNTTWSLRGSNTFIVSGISFFGYNAIVGGALNDTFSHAFATNFSGKIDGGQGTNAYTGPNLANRWSITKTNAGKLNNVTSFSNIQNLSGNVQQDVFAFADGASVAGTINGGGGRNALDYSKYKTAVTVSLATGSATGTGGISNIQTVRGGAGADTLSAAFTGSVLLGGPGNDVLNGATGRDVLLGGAGKDTITGGPEADLLISGTTKFDSNFATLDALFTYWNRNDLDYPTRVTDLRAGVTGVPALNGTNVRNDTSLDTLTGGSSDAQDLDWFFAKLAAPNLDTISDLNAGAGEVTN